MYKSYTFYIVILVLGPALYFLSVTSTIRNIQCWPTAKLSPVIASLKEVRPLVDSSGSAVLPEFLYVQNYFSSFLTFKYKDF